MHAPTNDPGSQGRNGFSLSAKLLLMNSAVFACFGVAVLLALGAFDRAEKLLLDAVAHDLDKMVRLSETGRSLTKLFGELDTYLASFHLTPDQAGPRGEALAKRAAEIAAAAPDAAAGAVIVDFGERTRVLVLRCVEAVGVKNRLSLTEEEARKGFETMRTALASASESKERFEAVERRFDRILADRSDVWSVHLFQDIDQNHQDVEEVESVVRDVLALTGSAPAFFAARDRLVAKLREAVYGLIEFHWAAADLKSAAGALAQDKQSLLAFMDAADREIAKANNRVREEISGVVREGGGAALGFFLLAGLTGVLVSTLFVSLNLRRPMRRLLDGAAAFGRGELDVPIRLGRRDEWTTLETGLNDMAARLAKSHAELARSEAFYTRMFELGLLGAAVADKSGAHFVDCNERFASMLGYTREEILALNCKIVTHPDDLPAEYDRWQAIAEGRESGFHVEKRFLKKDGSALDAAASIMARRADDGSVKDVFALVFDITDRVRAERALESMNRGLEALAAERTVMLEAKAAELELAKHRLTEIDRMKTGFLSSVSHELRTPLTSVLGFAKLIRRDFMRWFAPKSEADPQLGRIAERIADNLAVIESEGSRLTRLINDVLDLTKIESGRLSWRDRPTEPGALVESAVRAASGEFSQKPGIELTTLVSAGMPRLLVDPDRLMQVLVNLLNNAAKFTHRGFVRIEADCGDLNSACEERVVEIRVIDSGVGVPPDQLDAIFEKFHQAETDGPNGADAAKAPGTGLGLAISKRIVEHYGGSIRVKSRLGEGSTFIVRLPAPADQARPDGRDKPLGLVADDDAGMRRLLCGILSETGLSTLEAASGAEMLELAKNRRPELVVMDLVMPGPSGRGAVTALKNELALAGLRVIVVSGATPEASRGFGADAVFVKPLDEAAFVKTVRALVPALQDSGESPV